MRITLLITILLLVVSCPAILPGQSTADELLNQAEMHYRTYDFEDGLAALEALLLRQSKNGLTAEQLARLHCFRGECLFELDQEVASEEAFRLAWAYFSQMDTSQTAPAFAYRIPQALRIFAEEEAEKGEWRSTLSSILARSDQELPEILAAEFFYLALDTARAEHLPQGIELLKQSAELLKQVDHSQIDLYSTYNRISYYYEISGDDASALLYRKLSLAQCSSKKPKEYFRTLVNIAGFHLDLRQETACYQALQEAEKFATRHDLEGCELWPMYFGVAYELYNIVPRLDSMELVLDRQAQFYAEYPEMKVAGGYSLYLNQKAGIFIRNEAFDTADQYVRESLSCYDSEHYNTAVFLLSKVFCGQGSYERAIYLIHQLSCLYYVGGQGDCSAFPQDTVFLVEDFEQDFTLIQYLKDKASYYSQWYDATERDSLLDLSNANVMLVDSLLNRMRARGRYRGSSRRIDEISAELRKVEMANRYAAYRKENAGEEIIAALNSSEKVKQLAISERLHEQLMTQDFGLPAHVIEKEREYIDVLTNLLNESKTASDSSALVRFAAQMDSVKEIQLALQEHIRQEYPNYYNLLFDPKPLELENIRQKILGPDEVLLHYLEQGDQVFLVVINQEEQDMIRLKLDSSLTKVVPRLRSLMVKRSAAVFPILRRLYQQLLAPAEELIGDRDIVIVPDGQLWYLPFAALVKEDAPEGTLSADYRYLILDHDIRYLISGRQAYFQQQLPQYNTPNSSGILAMGPLAGSPLGKYKQLAGSDSTLLLLEQLSNTYYDHYCRNEEASVGKFITYAPTVALLHLGTHAVVDDEKPEDSFFVFNNQNPEEAFSKLTAERLYGMNMAAQLGVLSACSTGDGKLRRGQGVANLARAFAYAGCQNLIVNLWKVQDGVAKDLMEAFYPRLIADGVPAATAFNAAQRDFASSAAGNAHPANWAMGVYIGNNDTIELNNQPTALLVIGGVALGFLACLWLLLQTVREQQNF